MAELLIQRGDNYYLQQLQVNAKMLTHATEGTWKEAALLASGSQSPTRLSKSSLGMVDFILLPPVLIQNAYIVRLFV